MQVKLITVTNFLSFEELRYEFTPVPKLIQGENLTEDSQESNGAGKSCFMAAMEYAIDRTTSRKVVDAKLVRFKQSGAYIKLVIHCPIRNEELTVERKIKVKGGNESQLSVNNVIQFGFEDRMVTEIDKFILDWLGISKEDLKNFYIVSKERYKSFFSSSNKEKIELINRFTNAKIIDGLDKDVQVAVDKLEKELMTLERGKAGLLATVKTHKEQIDYEYNRDLKSEQLEEISKIDTEIVATEDLIESHKNDIKKIETSILDYEQDNSLQLSKLAQLNDHIGVANQRITDLNDNDFNDDFNVIKAKEEDISLRKDQVMETATKLRQDKHSIEEILIDINKNLMGAVICPKCNHEFLPGKEGIDIVWEKQEKESTQKLIDKTEETIKSTLEKITLFKAEQEAVYLEKRTVLSEWDKVRNKINDLSNNIKVMQRDVRSINDSITEVNILINIARQNKSRKLDEIVSCNERIERLQKSINEMDEKKLDTKRIEMLRSKMKVAGMDLRDHNKAIKTTEAEIFETAQWVQNFKRFNMHLANKVLKIVQGYCNKFLQEIKSDMQVRWEGYKLLADGKLKEEITAYVLRDDEQRDFWSFSGGEKARLEMAIIATIQDMINKTNKYGGLDFLSIDEVLDSADTKGLREIMKSLEGTNRTMLLTSHVMVPDADINKILIQKINGVSTIVNQ